MKRAGQVVVVVLCAMTLGVGVASANVKVGFTGVFSGPVAALGAEQYDGFMLAVKQLGGAFGEQDVKVLKRDTQLKPEVGIQVLRKLTNEENVDVVVGLGFSSVMLAMRDLLVETGVPAIATNSGPSSVAGELCAPNIFSMAWQNDGAAEAAGKYAEEQGYDDIFLAAPNYQAGKDMIAGFKRYYEGGIAAEVYTQLGRTNYSSLITRIQLASPDALFVFYPGGMGVSFVKQLGLAGVLGHLPFLSVFTVDGTTLPAIQQAAAGAMSATMWTPALDNPLSQDFVQSFKAAYGRMSSYYAAVGYDAARLLNLAVKRVGSNVHDHQALMRAIKAAAKDFDSVRGPFAFNVNNMPIQNYYLVKFVVEDGGIKQKTVGVPLEEHKDAYYQSCTLD